MTKTTDSTMFAAGIPFEIHNEKSFGGHCHRSDLNNHRKFVFGFSNPFSHFVPCPHRNAVLTDIDISACDSGLDTPPSTHRPSSYRDVYMSPGARDSTDTGVSSSRGTLVSPGGSFRAANGNVNGLR